MEDFARTTLGRTGLSVHRLGFSATYRPGRGAVHRALDEGLDFFFYFHIDTQAVRVLREILPRRRDEIVLCTGAYNLVWGHFDIRRSLEKRLRAMRTDCIDVFLFLGVLREREFGPRAREELFRLRDEGKVRAVGLSTHDRVFARKMADEGMDVLMVRYNAAHRGAEEDIFPHLAETNPGVVGYTATRWRQLLRRPRDWPADRPVPSAGQCYRFVLGNPHVHVCLTAPSNVRQLEENLAALREGPLDEDEMAFMREFGDFVHSRRRGFWRSILGWG